MTCVACDATATHQAFAPSVTPYDAEPFCCACVNCTNEDCEVME